MTTTDSPVILLIASQDDEYSLPALRVEEQVALRRVATLVARGVPSDELFAAVAAEVADCSARTSPG